MQTNNKFNKKILLLVSSIFLTLTFAIAKGQDDIAFKPGEKISYDLFYNWGMIWIHAGNAHFSAFETNYKDEPAYMFSVNGNSLKSFDKFYLVRDTFISIVNQKTFLPRYSKRIVREDKYWAEDEYWFKKGNEQKIDVVTQCKRRKGKNVDTLSLSPSITDLVTAIYKVRNADYTQLKKNDRIPFSIIFDDDDKPYDLWLSYQGKEKVKIRNGQTFNCVKLKPLLVKGYVFEDEDAMTIWITDDLNRIPIMIETKVRVGCLKVMLKNITNPKYPVTSLQK
jgi:hypothetical protein